MELKLGEISTGADGAVITVWHAGEGQNIRKGHDLLEVVTDKATFDIEAPCDGVLTRIIKGNGSRVRVDETIAEIREDRS